MRLAALAVAALALVAAGCASSSPERDASEDEAFTIRGWSTDFQKRRISLGEITPTGLGKDEIPPVDRPAFAGVVVADRWLPEPTPVVELELGGEARAYPLKILLWHEIVNDTIAGTPVAVTFCALCNSALVFDRRVRGRTLDFGTTGAVRNSDTVMYDRQTQSWWQRFGGEAIIGQLLGVKLRQIPAAVVAWQDFRREHPDGKVLSDETGFERAYGLNPWPGYDDARAPLFYPVANLDDDRLRAKDRVVFVERDGDSVALRLSALARKKRLEVDVGGERVEVTSGRPAYALLDQKFVSGSRRVASADVRLVATGERVAFDVPFWFLVAAFRPDVRIVVD